MHIFLYVYIDISVGVTEEGHANLQPTQIKRPPPCSTHCSRRVGLMRERDSLRTEFHLKGFLVHIQFWDCNTIVYGLIFLPRLVLRIKKPLVLSTVVNQVSRHIWDSEPEVYSRPQKDCGRGIFKHWV